MMADLLAEDFVSEDDFDFARVRRSPQAAPLFLDDGPVTRGAAVTAPSVTEGNAH